MIPGHGPGPGPFATAPLGAVPLRVGYADETADVPDDPALHTSAVPRARADQARGRPARMSSATSRVTGAPIASGSVTVCPGAYTS